MSTQEGVGTLWRPAVDLQTDLFDLLPEELRHRGSGLEGDFHVVGGVQELCRTKERNK